VKITEEQIESVEKDPFTNFLDGCKTERTKTTYETCLKKALMEHFDGILFGKTFENRVCEFVERAKQNPSWVSKCLKTYVKEFKKRCELPQENSDFIKPVSIDNYLYAIKKLMDTNEIAIVWKSIYALLPPRTANEETRGYSKSEIQKMLEHADSRDKAIILTACSSGIRKGGFDLKWKNLIPVYRYEDKLLWDVEDVTESVTQNGKVVSALLMIYADEHKASYIAFITPEAWNALQIYRETWYSSVGRLPKPEDPLFKQKGIIVKPLGPVGIATCLRQVLKESNLRPPLVKGKRRQSIPMMNGFRRFFNKAQNDSLSKNSILSQLIQREMMMGHSGLIKLDVNYSKYQISELIEEYLNAIPNLTISDEERNKLEIKKLKQNQTDIEKLLKKQMREQQIATLKMIRDALEDPEKFKKSLKNIK